MNIPFIHSGDSFDLILILLGFVTASAFKYKAEVTVTVLLLRLMRLGLHLLPQREKDEIRSVIDRSISRLIRRKKAVIPEDAVG